MPGMAGDDGKLSSGVLAGGVGMLIMAAVKSRCSQFNLRSSVLALRLERLDEKAKHRQHPSSETQNSLSYFSNNYFSGERVAVFLLATVLGLVNG